MRVQFEQHGGAIGFVPGLAEPVIIVSEKLPPEQRQQLHQLVDTAHLADLPGQAPAHPNVPTCRLCVETDRGERYDLRLAESAIPPHTRPLVEWLRKYAKGGSPSG